MKHIFYFIALFVMIRELGWLLSPIEKTEDVKEFDKLSKENKGKKWDSYSKEYKDLLKSKWTAIVSAGWLLMGMFSSQWILFVIILVFNFIIIAPISKLTKYSMAYTITHWLNSIIGLIFALFVIINAYHLHIDTYQYIKNLFN